MTVSSCAVSNSVVPINASMVQSFCERVRELSRAISGLSLNEAQRQIQGLEEDIYKMRGNVGTLPAHFYKEVIEAQVKVASMREYVRGAQARDILNGTELITASDNQFKSEWGRAVSACIAGKALKALLLGELQSKTCMDEVLAKGIDTYEDVIKELQAKHAPGYYKMGRHIGWPLEASHAFLGELKEVGDPIDARLDSDVIRVYEDLLRDLAKRIPEGRDEVGGVLLVCREFFAILIRKQIDSTFEVFLYDSHGAHAITQKNSPAYLLRVGSLQKAAQILAFRGEAFKSDRTDLNQVVCYPLELTTEMRSQLETKPKDLALIDPLDRAELPVERIPAVKIDDLVLITPKNRNQAVNLVSSLRQMNDPRQEEVLSFFNDYPELFQKRYMQVSQQIEFKDGACRVAVKAFVLEIEAQILFTDEKAPVGSLERVLNSPIVEEIEDGLCVEESIKGGTLKPMSSEVQKVSREQKITLVQEASKTTTLFFRDYVIPTVIKEDALDQQLLINHLDEWLKSVLPTLFFQDGLIASEGGMDGQEQLAIMAQFVGSLMTFLNDYNQAAMAIELQQKGGWIPWRSRPKELTPNQLEGQLARRISEMGDLKLYGSVLDEEANTEEKQRILRDFSHHLLTLYETRHKPMSEEVKKDLTGQISQVFQALIEVITSQEFAKAMALGFIEDENISETLQAFQLSTTVQTAGGVDVPEALKEQLSQFVGSVIDLGNPFWSSWIVAKMLKSRLVDVGHPGYWKRCMGILFSPLFQGEISDFLSNALSISHRSRDSEEWVKTATLSLQLFRKYNWKQGRLNPSRFSTKVDIPEQLFQKILKIARANGPGVVGKTITMTAWVMPSVHTFGRTLTKRVFDLSQSPRLMRLYTYGYLIQKTLTPELQRRCACAGSLSPSQELILRPAPPRLIDELGSRMSCLVGDYLRKYIAEIYLKDSPLVRGITDLGVTMIQHFLPDVITHSYSEELRLPLTKQEIVVHLYGSVGPFINDYAKAVQIAKQSPRFEVLESQGKEDELILQAIEKVRGAPLKIRDRDVQEKLQLLTSVMVQAFSKNVTPSQAALISSASEILPKLLKGSLDLFFSPQMMNRLCVTMLDSLSLSMPSDPHAQSQSWDSSVLLKWNDSILAFFNGLVNLGEPEGKIAQLAESFIGVGKGIQKNWGSLLARISGGPDFIISPAANLATVEMLEKMLWIDGADRSKERRIQQVFTALPEELERREQELREKMQRLLMKPLPVEQFQSLTSGWVDEMIQNLTGFGEDASRHIQTLSELFQEAPGASPSSPLGEWVRQEATRRVSSLGLPDFLTHAFTPIRSQEAEAPLFQGVHGVFYEQLSKMMSSSDIMGSFTRGNPIVKYLNNMCCNIIKFTQSKSLMRAYVYNYVLTPEFFAHLIRSVNQGLPLSQSPITAGLPSSLFLDLNATSWIVPGNKRNRELMQTPELTQGVRLNLPHPSYDFRGSLLALEKHLLETRRLFEASTACPMLNNLFAQLSRFEESKVVDSSLVANLVNSLENHEKFETHVQSFLTFIGEKGVISVEEKVALGEKAKEGEYPFIFRYAELKMIQESPVLTTLEGPCWKQQLEAQFLSQSAIGLNGSLLLHIEVLQLGLGVERWLEEVLSEHQKEAPAIQKQIETILEIVAEGKRKMPQSKKIAFLLKEGAKYLLRIKNLSEVQRVFIEDMQLEFEKAADPLLCAMKLFNIYTEVGFWERNTQKIHEKLDQLVWENQDPSINVLKRIEPALKAYYEGLGHVLSQLLVRPYTDRQQMSVMDHFLERYCSIALAKAPLLGEVREESYQGVNTAAANGSNNHKLELLRYAEKSIVISGCYFGGTIFDQALDVIREQLERKPDLDVKLIGSEYMITPSNRKKIEALETHFSDRFYVQLTSEVQFYSSPKTGKNCYYTNHTKLLVIDYGRYFIIGGSGMEDRWVQTTGSEPMVAENQSVVLQPLAFRDTDFIIRNSEQQGVGYRFYFELLRLFPNSPYAKLS